MARKDDMPVLIYEARDQQRDARYIGQVAQYFPQYLTKQRWLLRGNKHLACRSRRVKNHLKGLADR